MKLIEKLTALIEKAKPSKAELLKRFGKKKAAPFKSKKDKK